MDSGEAGLADLGPGGRELVDEAEKISLLASRVRDVLAGVEGHDPAPGDLAEMTTRAWAAYRAAGYR